MAREVIAAMADSHVTADEARRMDAELADVERAVASLRAALTPMLEDA